MSAVRHGALITILAVAMCCAESPIWPPGLEAAIGRKRVFLNPFFNGITLADCTPGCKRLHADLRPDAQCQSGAWLAVFVGGYIGYAISTWTGSWVLSFVVHFLAVALVGVLLASPGVSPHGRPGICGRPWSQSDSRSCSPTDAVAFGGDFYQVQTPSG